MVTADRRGGKGIHFDARGVEIHLLVLTSTNDDDDDDETWIYIAHRHKISNVY